MLQVGYGSMLLESLLAILVIVIVGALPNLKASGVLDSTLANMALADTATPFTKFSAGVTGLVAQLGLPQSWGLCIIDNVCFSSCFNFIRCCCKNFKNVFPRIL